MNINLPSRLVQFDSWKGPVDPSDTVEGMKFGPLHQAVGKIETLLDLTKVVRLDKIVDRLSFVRVLDGINEIVVVFVIKGVIVVIYAFVIIAFNLVDFENVENVDLSVAVGICRLNIDLGLNWKMGSVSVWSIEVYTLFGLLVP